MSSGDRMGYLQAKILADKMMNILADACARIEIAGSIRRHEPTCGDVEMVCIPHKETVDLFGGEVYGHKLVEDALLVHGFKLLKSGELYKRAQFPQAGGAIAEVFITTPEKWGCIFTIRTGPAWFSHKLVTKRREGGLCPSNMDFSEGRLWRNGMMLDTPEEADVFRELGLEWIEPEARK